VTTVTPDERNAWLQKLDAECPYQIVLPRRQLTDDSAIMDFLLSSNVGKFDMYVEDQCAAYVRYCFQDPMDIALVSRSMATCRPSSNIGLCGGLRPYQHSCEFKGKE
jgi:hypothetical protein